MISKLIRQHGLVLLTGVLPISLLGILLSINQPYYPATWQDEGFVLQGAINLIRYGEYAMLSSEGFRVLDQPLIANGPGIVLPLALTFKLLGIGLLQARMISVVIAVLAAFLFYLLTKTLSGKYGASLALILLIAVPMEGYLVYGRHALGIVPALTYFFLGFLILLSAYRRNSVPLGFLAGIVMGLAVITKGQYMILIPAFIMTFGVNVIKHRKSEAKITIITLLGIGVIFFLWLFVQYSIVGADQFGNHIRAIQSSSQVTIMAFKFFRIPGNLWYLFRSGILLCIFPGVIYSTYCLIKKDFNDQAILILISLLLIWLTWYVFISVGWHRYAFAPFVVGLLLSSRAFQDLIQHLHKWRTTSLNRDMGSKRIIAASAYLGLILVFAGISIFIQISNIFKDQNTFAEQFAAYLNAEIDQDTTIESWEWELDVFSQLNFHHPSNRWVDEFTALLQFNEPLISEYDPTIYNPKYLVDGPFSKWTGIYRDLIKSDCYKHVVRVGNYDLYVFQDE